MTIKDISRESGYSIGTVSRVLNNSPNVSQKAYNAIMAVVEKNHFLVNSNAKQLKKQGLRSIAVIVKGSKNMLFSSILESLQDIISKEEYLCLIYYIDEKDFNFDNANNISNIDGIKIVDNLKYYLCIRVKAETLEDIDVDKSIKVNVGNSVATGIIKRVKKGSEYDLIVAQFSSAFNEIADKRFIDLNVIKTVSSSFELPLTALTSKDGEDYVLMVDSFGNIKRAKVNVKFIDKINSKVYIDSKNSSVGIFSNILKDASKVKEGAILK